MLLQPQLRVRLWFPWSRLVDSVTSRTKPVVRDALESIQVPKKYQSTKIASDKYQRWLPRSVSP